MENRKVKILLLGDSKVGKTALVNRIVEENFSPSYYQTLVFDFKLKNYKSKFEEIIKLYFFDIGGDKRFEKLSSVYFKNADVVFLVFDITNRQSFENLENWYNKVISKVNYNHKMCLIGTKLDLEKERKVTYDEAANNKFNLSYFETSSKNDINLEFINIVIDSKIEVSEKTEKIYINKTSLFRRFLNFFKRC
jgi:small GTP-binding protein